jgi:hypothetical protein
VKRSLKLGKLWLSHYVYGGDSNSTAAWFVVRDRTAGSKGRYTVYRISLVGSQEATVIGRELPLPLARELVRKDRDQLEIFA